jgi:hypothetical protein
MKPGAGSCQHVRGGENTLTGSAAAYAGDYARRQRHSGLLETLAKVDVWPDSTEVLGGLALFWAAHCRPRCGPLPVCGPLSTADEAWLKRGLPSS